MEFIEAPVFTRLLAEYLTDDEYARLQCHLSIQPAAGDVIPGTGGFRKVRWSDPRRGQGRRGGLRVVYYFFPQESQIWLVTLYAKGEATDLTPSEKRLLKAAADAENLERAKQRGGRKSR